MQSLSRLFRVVLGVGFLLPFQMASAQQQLSGIVLAQRQTAFAPARVPSVAIGQLIRTGNLRDYIVTAPQFILLGSTKHTLSDLTLLSSGSFLDALIEGGVQNLFLEIPRDQQGVLDGEAPVVGIRFANLGSGEAEAAAHHALSLLISRANAKGLKLIAYDFNTWSGAPSTASILNDALRCYAGHPGASDSEDPFEALALHAERLAHDGDAAAFIKSKAGAGKSLIFGGAEHTARKDGLAFALGRSETAVIHISPSLNEYSDFLDNLEFLNLSLPQTLFNEAPDELLTLDDGMVKPPSAAEVERIRALKPGTWHSALCPRKMASLGG